MSRPKSEILGEPDSTVLLLGNEAIARGAIEYGIGVCSCISRDTIE
jgi:TPP-dependent indolepyruvate ferredoxin oxidoreductase alpha subunit